MTRDQIAEFLAPRADAALRAKQIARHLYRGSIADFAEMSDLPQDLRDDLGQRASISPLTISKRVAAADGVQKLLVHSGDEQSFECVLLPFERRVSCCISTQVGCPMGCTFCATGIGGFDRNLSAQEIVAQVWELQRLTPRRIGHVVFMGMGEPLLNLNAVVLALRTLNEEFGVSYRRMTVSTVGIVPAMHKLAGYRLPIHLAVSLHSSDDSVRSRLMPVNHKWPIKEVMAAARDYARITGRKVTFEYLMIAGVNDSDAQAEGLADLVRGLPCLVNLIPFNYVASEEGYRRSSPQRIRAFRKLLETRGVNVTERVERGHKIAAACGQLAGNHAGRFARRNFVSAVRTSS